MIVYVDTSVLLASLDPKHELHDLSASAIATALKEGEVVTTTLHTYAELYNHLTHMGVGRARFPAKFAREALWQSIGTHFRLIELVRADFEAAVDRCVELELTRSIIYDALHYQAALKAGADVLLTDNLRDFTRLRLPEETLELRALRPEH